MPDERNATSSGPCVEPEVLAAYVERTLPPDERAQVDAHLAVCGDCYALLTEVLRTSDEMDVARVLRPAFGRWRVWTVAGGVLAAAAAVVLIVRVPGSIGAGARRDDPRVEQLVAAVGSERPTEGRLTGGFVYAPYRPPVRTGSAPTQDLSRLAAAGELQKAASADPTAANLHAYGVAQLVLGEYDPAIRTLERAAQQRSTARLQSDLSVAYMARARFEGRADDWPRALAAAERAIASDDAALEARFNRAVAASALGLRDQAASAWHDYLAHDERSPWAEEARRRAAEIETKPRSRWDTDREQ